MTSRNKDNNDRKQSFVAFGAGAVLMVLFAHNFTSQKKTIKELEGRIKQTKNIFQESRRDYNAAVDAEGNPFIKDTVIYVSTKDMRKAGFTLNP